METKRTFLRIIFSVLIFQFSFFNVLAQEATFSQKIEWKSNANALEYKVELQNIDTGRTQSITTDKTSTELSLVPGKYRYRVYAYDFLGKQASVSAWTNFEVFKANKPNIKTVEKEVKIPKDSNSIGIDVNISDVNQNSKFELISDGLEGVIPYSDRSKMKSSGSETDSVSHLDFENVPPGKWRLRVTNASGFSSISDVITVEGEKKYTEAEVAQIKKEAEDAIRKDMQDNLDEYIRRAEAEKKAEAERIAREKAAEEERARLAAEEAERKRLAEEARIKAERDEAERARLAEERRIAEEKAAREKAEAEARAEAERLAKIEEERRIAEEKAREEAERIAKKEAEKKAKAEWKATHPYQWKDIIFEGGLGFTLNVQPSTITDLYDEQALALSVRAIILPWKTKTNKFGLEFAFMAQTFDTEKVDFYEGNLKSNIFDVKFVWQHKLFKQLFCSVKGGVGVDAIETKLSYTGVSVRNSPDEKQYLYPAVTAGASLFFYPWKFIVCELGADFSYVLSGSVPLGLATPYACIGFRL